MQQITSAGAPVVDVNDVGKAANRQHVYGHVASHADTLVHLLFCQSANA